MRQQTHVWGIKMSTSRGIKDREDNPNDKLWVLAKSWICCRTTSIPLSSDALSSKIILGKREPYSLRATARMVDVLPVPGGPYNKRCGNLFSVVSLSTTQQINKQRTTTHQPNANRHWIHENRLQMYNYMLLLISWFSLNQVKYETRER